jgi:glycerol-3-phosphate dehydrogenase
VAVRDHLTGRDGQVDADLVVNATGPWCGRLAALAGAALPVRPSAGALVALEGRLCDLVVTRLHPAGGGDMVVPQRILSIVGTSAWTVEDPDDLEVPDEHVQTMRREGARLVPAVAAAAEWAVWAAAWPLVDAAGGSAGGRELSRGFQCFDHAATDGVEGLVTVTGGTATSLRAMAEATADLICRKLGVDAACRTREVVLEPHTAYYTGRAA